MRDLTIKTEETLLLVVDVQEKLVPAMHPELWSMMAKNLERWGTATELLGIPVLITEQYPKGLGPTLPAIKSVFPNATTLEKTTFDAIEDPAIWSAIEATGKKRILVAGMETHICVYQTVRSLAGGHSVHVLSDAVASRTRENFAVGLDLIRQAGAIVTSTETVLFDLLRRAGSDAFKTISKLVR